MNLVFVAVETYPSEALRAELSVKLGLSDRQLQMWFCHRRLKDRKTPPMKRPRKEDASPAVGAAVGSSSGVGEEMVVGGEAGNNNEHGSGSGSFGHMESYQQQRGVGARGGAAIARIATDMMPAVKRYYEPPQALSELRAIAFVEAQLGEHLREDGPILGMEFDPLPPGAFGAPIGMLDTYEFGIFWLLIHFKLTGINRDMVILEIPSGYPLLPGHIYKNRGRFELIYASTGFSS